MKYNRIKRFVRNGFKPPDDSNYKWGIPYDPVEEWFKIYYSALNVYRNEVKDIKKETKAVQKELKKFKKSQL